MRGIFAPSVLPALRALAASAREASARDCSSAPAGGAAAAEHVVAGARRLASRAEPRRAAPLP